MVRRALAVAALLLGACATVTPNYLVGARDAYEASASGLAASKTPTELYEAKRSLDQANREYAANGDSYKVADYSYVAFRKVELADVKARTMQSTERTAELFLTLKGKHSLMVVEHDMSFIRAISDIVTVLCDGSVLAQGTLDQIASAARLINGGSGLTTSPLAPATPTVAPQAAPVAVPQPRTHVVQEGDSLTRISSRYYGTTGRWQEIYEANREVLKGENALRPGQRLKIP